MRNKYFTVLISLSTLMIGFLLGYIISNDIFSVTPDKEVLAAMPEELVEKEADTEEIPQNPVPAYDYSDFNTNPARINNDTKIIYQYYYLKDGITEIIEESPPLFLLDKTESDVKESLNDWEIVMFTESEVVVRKELDEKSGQHYIIGIYEGYVAVFLDGQENTPVVREITGKPASALSDNEILRLEQGISVFGDDALFKILEDYGS